MSAQAVTWINPKQVLRGTALVDLDLRTEIANYQLPGRGRLTQSNPDGRLWYAGELGLNNNTTVLTGYPLPDPKAQSVMTAFAAGMAEFLTPPGTNFQVKIETNVDKLRTAIEQALPKHLEDRGFKIGPGGLTITISAQDAPTGKTIDFEITKLGGPGIPRFGRERVKITERQVTCQVTLSDAQGNQLQSRKSIFQTPTTHSFQGDDYQAQLDESMIRTAASTLSQPFILANLYRIQGQTQTLPLHVLIVNK
jgi:hypothetical protein